MNYTHAYSTYTVMTVVAPAIPNNEGAFRPMTITAPPGSILNCRRPAAVAARHLIGHFVSQPILTALGQAVPERVMAEGSAGLWNTMLEGRTGQDGELFAYIFFSAGGMGARAHRDGLSATAFPSGITGVPAEAIEAVAPVLLHRRALIRDSGGARAVSRRAGAGDGAGGGHRPRGRPLAHVRPHAQPGARLRRR